MHLAGLLGISLDWVPQPQRTVRHVGTAQAAWDPCGNLPQTMWPNCGLALPCEEGRTDLTWEVFTLRVERADHRQTLRLAIPCTQGGRPSDLGEAWWVSVSRQSRRNLLDKLL